MSVKNGAVPNEETKTAFTLLPIHFPDATEKLKTVEFLDASVGLVNLVEKFGKVFAPVVNDMNGNIRKLRQRYEEDADLHKDLETMILREQVEGDMLATDGLLWLRRALHFLSIFFQCIVIDSDSERASQDLTPFVKRAYTESLEPHHGWLGTQLFNVLSRFAPSRKHLFYTLAVDRHHKDEQVVRDMRIYNQKMTACVVRLSTFYVEHRNLHYTYITMVLILISSIVIVLVILYQF